MKVVRFQINKIYLFVVGNVFWFYPGYNLLVAIACIQFLRTRADCDTVEEREGKGRDGESRLEEGSRRGRARRWRVMKGSAREKRVKG